MVWTVWDVLPDQHHPQSRQISALPEEMSGGWLCFESPEGKRRLYPIPPRWEQLPDDRLHLLCHAGVPAGRPPLPAGPAPAAPAFALAPMPAG